MNKEHESDLTVLYVKVGDYYFPNITLPQDAGDIGFWGRRRREFLRNIVPLMGTERSRFSAVKKISLSR